MADARSEKNVRLHWHDRLFAVTILRLVPVRVKPNHITVVRFFMIPFLAGLMYYGNYRIGLIAFLFAALTDMIDGSLARTRGQISAWGQKYDPLADKLLIGTMVYVIVLRYLDQWTAYLIIILEFTIILATWVRRRGVVPSNIWGKLKMGFQVLGVTILLLTLVFDWGSLLPFASGIFYLAIVLAVISLLTYSI